MCCMLKFSIVQIDISLPFNSKLLLLNEFDLRVFLHS